MLWKGFQRPKRLEFERETLTDRFGRFYAQPFERGFGTTVGNAMRRVLLSSIEGAAVTAVKIEGVLHEFSPIQGVVEDATDIILNLKQIPLKVHTDQPKTLTLRATKPGEVRARDIVADADVEILEPDAHIATVSDGGKLEMELRIKRGRGYVSADKNFDEDLGIGWIPIDSVHSPVKKVNYVVEAARIGQTTDYDKLTLEVWTNGAVTPRDAVSLAAKLIRDHFTIFVGLDEAGDQPLEGVGDDARRRGSTRTSTRASRSSSSPCGRTTASRTRTSAPFASSCRRPKARCSRPRTSAESRSTRSRTSWRRWASASACGSISRRRVSEHCHTSEWVNGR